MPTWITPAGLLATIVPGNASNVSLQCNTANSFITYSIISGSLPPGFDLSGPTSFPQLPYPTLWGTADVSGVGQTYPFTIRATDSSGISDRSFSFVVVESTPSYMFPNSNLGAYSDGLWMVTSVAPQENVPEFFGNIVIVAGSLPGNVTLDANTGIISGWVNPEVLYNSQYVFDNAQANAAPIYSSNVSSTFNFTVQYAPNITANYNLVIQRADLSLASGTLGSPYNYADWITPAGTRDGFNQAFTLANIPVPPTNLQLYSTGALLTQGANADYTLFNNLITFNVAPIPTAFLAAFYTY